VKVTWVAGYGATADAVPPSIRSALLMLVAHLYDNRSAANAGNITSELPFTVAALLAPYRRVGT
jgi:uncharacterized phiE125 gp8 family phage protein